MTNEIETAEGRSGGEIPSAERAKIIEEVAQWIEEASFLDLRGILSRRKRDREDAEVRRKARDELRAEIADMVRGRAGNGVGDPVATLKRLMETDGRWIGSELRSEGWPLVFKGWIDVTVITHISENSLPARSEFRITLTDEGKKALADAQALATPSPESVA